MNKYQEALDRLEHFDYNKVITQREMWFDHKQHDNDVELIQELVDRATPKKPIVDDKHFYDDGICPNCHSSRIANWEFNDVFYKHCADCGQALNWSKDE